MTEDKLRSATVRASRAKALLDDEMLKEAFDALESDYIRGWRETNARDTDGRERLWQALQIVSKVRDHLKTAVNNGKLAQAEIDALVKDQDRKRRFGLIG